MDTRSYFFRKSAGVTASSYGLVVGLIAIVALTAVTQGGEAINNLFTGTNGAMQTVLGDTAVEEQSASSPWDFTFTTCGATGQFGPSGGDCTAEYGGLDIGPGSFAGVTSGVQSFAVPYDGLYRFTVLGARGGSGKSGDLGGNGAEMVATFNLNEGQVIDISVGQAGIDRAGIGGSTGGGGGGGSFVSSGGTPLVIAGGGGGGHFNASSIDSDGLTGENGGAGIATGGTAGSGGSTTNGDGGGAGGGGGGWLTSGASNSWSGGGAAMGGIGGTGGGGSYAVGSFGGGGGSQHGGGGGGGYSGGGGGGGSSAFAGGGGGSYVDASGSLVSSQKGANAGPGSILVEFCPGGDCP
ncbi:MAG: hypothetical protein Alpg2KO_24510 [Alphaproteobacteria bacterium]